MGIRYAQIPLKEDFERGQCSECPFCYDEWFAGNEDEDSDIIQHCCLGYYFDECRLDILETKKIKT